MTNPLPLAAISLARYCSLSNAMSFLSLWTCPPTVECWYYAKNSDLWGKCLCGLVFLDGALEDGDESGLRHVDVAELLHAGLAALLLLEDLHLARHVTAVKLG